MFTFDDYLELIGVGVTREIFEEVINSLPEVDDPDLLDDCYYNNSADELSDNIINYFLRDFSWCYCDNVDFENKSFELTEVESLEDLEKIKELFKGWTISNYDSIKEEILEDEKDKISNNRKTSILNKIFDNSTLEEIEELYNKWIEKHDKE